ncbi:MAG TPA: ABC transporter ATP-binding protein [Deinococcales bacterium]|nr:ABC transporter ATP-binding protein [Deinococcales bacterium]
MKAITKRFPLVLANDNVNLSVRWGEVHALVGENGAGKSTLMNILYGLQPPDSGEILLDGEAVQLRDARDSMARGVGMVHQHFMLVEPLTVTENIILGAEPSSGPNLDYSRARRDVTALIKQFGFAVSADAKIENLPVGLQQKVEILKTLYRRAEILILDEPTAVLTPLETEELFKFIREFAAQGNAVIFITHKLREVIEVSDTISVMRDGKMVGSVANKNITPPEIARMMVGREVILKVEKDQAKPGAPALELKDVRVKSRDGQERVRGVSFTVREGEIVGIAGVEGNGQSQLVEAITGLAPSTGEIRYLGRSIHNADAYKVRHAGVSHIPEDRNERGLVLDYSTAENLILGDHGDPPYTGQFGMLNFPVIEAAALKRIEQFDVRPRSTRLSAHSYSGGNAQKIIVARELSRQPKVLVASQPTRGVDIGAIEFIHSELVRARDNGLGVLLVSADLGEVMSLADRILVMYEGEIVGEVPAAEATEEKLGLLMAGVKA